MLTILAPAKLNLTLEVKAKRDDGFHEIRSVIQTISLVDRLTFEPGETLEIKSASSGWLAEESLVSRTAALLRQVTGCSNGATITVSKQIPLLAGLGGDSSDAGATLRGLNQLWELGLSREELLKLAVQLGSDVSFFLYGGTARLEGRGERVTPLPALTHRWVVLALPPVARLPGKTKQLYESLTTNHFTDGWITEKLVEVIKGGGQFIDSFLFNTFENVAFTHFSSLDVSRSHMLKMGASHIHLAGTGPALFTLIADKARAEDLYTHLKQQNLEPYLAETLAEVI